MKAFAPTLALCSLICTTPAQAADLSCYADPRTAATQCLDLKQVREEDGIRFARLYVGGPKGVRLTNYYLHSNCATGVTHLKDQDGVSFAGGGGNETPAIVRLRNILCGASVRKK